MVADSGVDDSDADALAGDATETSEAFLDLVCTDRSGLDSHRRLDDGVL
jgi:hypothetical protein